MILKSRECSLFYCHFYKGVLSSPHITFRVGTFCCSLEGAGSVCELKHLIHRQTHVSAEPAVKNPVSLFYCLFVVECGLKVVS